MAPNAQSSSVLSAGSLPHLAIVDKLSEYPIVNSAIGYANDRYAALKSSHHLVNSTLDRAEKSLQLVVNNGVVPVLNKLEQPIHYADNIAVQGLDLAVAKINVISKQSEELTVTGRNLVGQTRQAVEQTAESVKERLVSVKTSTVQTVQAKVQSVLAAPSHAVPLLDQILAAGEHVLDYLLPEMKKAAAAANGSAAAAEEAVPANPDTRTVIRLVISRMRRFSEKVQKRIIDYGRDRWVPLLVEKAMSLKDGLVLISPLITSKLLSNGHAASSSSSSSTSPVTSNSSSPSSKTAATAATTSSSSSTPPKTGGAASASNSSSPLATSTPKSGSPAANGDASKSTDEDNTVEAK